MVLRTVLLSFLVLEVCGGIVGLVILRRSATRNRDAERAAYTFGLPLEAGLDLGRRTARRHLARVIGAFAFTLAALVVCVASPQVLRAAGPLPESYSGLVGLALVWVGSQTGLAVVGLTEQIRLPVPERVARAQRPTLLDYISPARLASLAAIPLAGTMAVLAAALPPVTMASTMPTAMTVMALAFAVLTALFAVIVTPLLLARRQVAGSKVQLMWEDALRGQDLQMIWGTAETFGWLALFVASVRPIQLWIEGGLPWWGQAMVIAMGAVALVLGGWSIVTESRWPLRRFRRRLWPDEPILSPLTNAPTAYPSWRP